jgi:ATP-dependent exoDNAse (exonuclease V) beta subunit
MKRELTNKMKNLKEEIIEILDNYTDAETTAEEILLLIDDVFCNKNNTIQQLLIEKQIISDKILANQLNRREQVALRLIKNRLDCSFKEYFKYADEFLKFSKDTEGENVKR